AKKVQVQGVPELAAAVEVGRISVSAAADLAKLPRPEQDEVASQGPAALRQRVRRLRVSRADISLGQNAAASTRHVDMLEAAWSACSPTERQTFMNRHGLLFAPGQVDAAQEPTP
ncbi:MAG: hypothetical protein ACTHOR_19970, partial [Devosia sp.]